MNRFALKSLAVLATLTLCACGGGSGGSYSSSSTYSSSSGSGFSEIGGSCVTDGDCAGSEVCATNLPGGYCTQECSSNPSVCGAGNACVNNRSGTGAVCYITCDVPGTQSSCRSGYTCFALAGKSFGVCMGQ